MDTHPTESPVTAKTMLAPPIVWALVAYGVLIVIAALPNLFVNAEWLRHFWIALPLGLVSYAIPVALFLAVFAINEKRAILVPICGVLAAGLLQHYLMRYPEEYMAEAFEQVRLRDNLWSTIKYSLPEALLVGGLAMVAARWWALRDPGDQSRFVIPPVKPALIFFAVCAAIELGFTFADRSQFLPYYVVGIINATAGTFLVIAMCVICAVALRPWTGILPLLVIGIAFAGVAVQPGVCDVGDVDDYSCWSFLWTVLRMQIFALTSLFVLSVLAGGWGRDEEDATLEPELDPATQSG